MKFSFLLYLLVCVLAPSALLRIIDTQVQSKSLTIEWDKVATSHQNESITGYRLRYSTSDGINYAIINITGEEDKQYTLTELTPYIKYSVQVAAVNDEGTGPYSEPILIVETLQEGELN